MIPQMAPMSWLTLYILFLLLFFLFNFMNYYLFLVKNKNNEMKNINKHQFNWKW
uniref:ATP synthase complex subunit 8 n=1 Tax=Hygrobia hermanni TaxID=107881 RepID=A0A191ZRK3_9COLE|nr:ATP synthase F0 subunit 8 [Hygrobia hermanni]ANJ70493.1 ATP synthase F0 subunit 8 [Hygrobia hermanni]